MKKELVKVVDAPEKWDQWVHTSSSPAAAALLVMDVHPEWCGPCSDVLESFYKTVRLELDDAEGSTPVQFLSVNRATLDTQIRGLFPQAPPPPTTSGSSSSSKQQQPTPPQAPLPTDESTAAVAAYETGSCRPLFLFVKGRQVVASLSGINTQLMHQMIRQHAAAGSASPTTAVGGGDGPAGTF